MDTVVSYQRLFSDVLLRDIASRTAAAKRRVFFGGEEFVDIIDENDTHHNPDNDNNE